MPGGPNAEGLPALTPYLIEGDHTRAAVVVCPGGGYARRAPHESGPVARWLNTLGLHAFVLDYRVAPHRHPVPLGDARRALRFVRHHAREWRVDPQRIGILGFSAGGHLAASVSTHFDDGNPEADDPIEHHSCRPDLAILCYAVITFGDAFRHTGSMRNLLGDDPPEALRRLLSNELHVTADTPPTFLWHTAEDAGVPVENSLLYAAALSRHKVPFELHVYPTGKHGLGLAQDHPQVRNWTELCAVWLRSMGYGA
ncbi:MAG: alpha/beta hydrolase [Chloroflexi bacterium]|nr:alpha/beta hydrolase [Chloroflexota bacterium]